ncbi:PQQ-binding-like beta-propeller repeat protein [Candidatus Micrarchaeota archaeon]|nr:PQQ-binding-like beta-propeller repeat protein [Candidatus Micrarchaeota archaeon]
MKKILLTFFLISLASASHMWQFDTDSAVFVKPITYQGNVIVASDEGNVYSLAPLTGLKQWQTNVGGAPNELLLFDNAVVVSSTSGKVTKIGANGNVIWSVNLNTTTYNVSYIYGASTNDNKIYVSAENGIYELTKTGNATRLVSFEDSVVTAPATGPNYVIYGRENQLVRVSLTGATQWTVTLDQGSFWLSKPIVDGGVVYIGALDNKMHAYSIANGQEVWEVRTDNWVFGTALVDTGVVYFGSNDGSIYAIDKGSGDIKWEAETRLAVQSQPESGQMGGQNVVFVGSNDKNIYAIAKTTGDIVWKGSAGGAVGSPLYYQNLIIYGSRDKEVNAHIIERACSITSPIEAQLIGTKELVASGKYVSEAGGAMVWISINGAEWIEANTTNDGWILYLDPSKTLVAGLNTIVCMVADVGGQESGPDFTSVAINHNPNMELANFVITTSPNIIEGEEFVIYVNDGDDGSPVERFSWTMDGQSGTSDKNITITINEPKTYQLTVTKMGFNNGSVNITVNASGVNPLLVGAGVLVILIIVWQVWTRIISKRFAKKK